MTRPRLLDLPHGHQTMVDDDIDLSSLGALYVGSHGYVNYSRWANGKSTPYLLHRTITAAPPGTHVDHINGDKLDNRRTNLRITTPQLNQVNRKRLNRNNRSGVRGVSCTAISARNPWRAQIMVCGKQLHLGLFATQTEAMAARRAAELLHYGELCP